MKREILFRGKRIVDFEQVGFGFVYGGNILAKNCQMQDVGLLMHGLT